MVEITLTVPDKDLAKLLRTEASSIECHGATGGLKKAVPAFVEVISAPRGPYSSQQGESYVLCPRLTEFYYNGSEFRCFEGDNPHDVDMHDKAEMEKAHPCPYYNPAKKD